MAYSDEILLELISQLQKKEFSEYHPLIVQYQYDELQDKDKQLFIDHCIEMVAKSNDEMAMLYLGCIYEHVKDINKARYWFEKAANAGNISAMYELGYLYSAYYSSIKNINKAIYW
ncbi:MAG: tetratricopeptide repeat protein, partial [Neisseriaceae bacterium]